MNEQWRTPRPRGQWRGSPGQWRGGGSPRYGGGRGRGHSPGFQRFWQPSPYQQIPPPFATSTPFQRTPRPYFGHRGKPRFESHSRNQDDFGISAWVSPAMWEDPWKEFYEEEENASMSGLNETGCAEDSMGDTSTELEQSDSAVPEGETKLCVSDMILKSFVEPEPDSDGGCKPLPNVTMEDLKDGGEVAVPSTEKTDDCSDIVKSSICSEATSNDGAS